MTDQKGTPVSQLHGKYFQQAVNGNVYVGNSAVAGAVVPIYSNTTQQYGIMNPAGSGKYLVPISVEMAYIDTTAAAGGLCIGYLKNAGSEIATGNGGVTAATTATPISMRLDGPASSMKFMSAGITTAAPSLLMPLGINQLVVTATEKGVPFDTLHYEFDGKLVVPPGNAIFLAGVIAVLWKLAPSFIWEEIPVAQAIP